MPLSLSDFPEEVQVAFFIFNLLSDRYAGMDGVYIGKDWGDCEYLLKIYDIESPKETIFFMKLYESLLVRNLADKAKRESEAAQKRASSGAGKSYTHSVKG